MTTPISEGRPFIERGISASAEQAYTFSPDGHHSYRIVRFHSLKVKSPNMVVNWEKWSEWYADKCCESSDGYESWERMVGTYDSAKRRPQSWATVEDAVAACVLDCETEYAP